MPSATIAAKGGGRAMKVRADVLAALAIGLLVSGSAVAQSGMRVTTGTPMLGMHDSFNTALLSVPYVKYQGFHALNQREIADEFSAAYNAPPATILKNRTDLSNIVLSDVPVRACKDGSRAAFALDKRGHVAYGCETATTPWKGYFSVCWQSYGCRVYALSKWDVTTLSDRSGVRPTPATRQ